MALFRYFTTNADTMLPDPRGPLATVDVNHVCKRRGEAAASGPASRGTDNKRLVHKVQKAEIGKRAAEHGVAATVYATYASSGQWAWPTAIRDPRKLFPRNCVQAQSAKILRLENIAL